MSTVPLPKVDFRDCARGEEASDTWHEWLDGDVFAMAGGTPRSGMITH